MYVLCMNGDGQTCDNFQAEGRGCLWGVVGHFRLTFAFVGLVCGTSQLASTSHHTGAHTCDGGVLG